MRCGFFVCNWKFHPPSEFKILISNSEIKDLKRKYIDFSRSIAVLLILRSRDLVN